MFIIEKMRQLLLHIIKLTPCMPEREMGGVVRKLRNMEKNNRKKDARSGYGRELIEMIIPAQIRMASQDDSSEWGES